LLSSAKNASLGLFDQLDRASTAKLGDHSFRPTGITAYLKNGGTLEKSAAS